MSFAFETVDEKVLEILKKCRVPKLDGERAMIRSLFQKQTWESGCPDKAIQALMIFVSDFSCGIDAKCQHDVAVWNSVQQVIMKTFSSEDFDLFEDGAQRVLFKTEFGCVIVFTVEGDNVGAVVYGLDEWKNTPFLNDDGSVYSTAISHSFSAIHCGSVSCEEFDGLKESLESLNFEKLEKANRLKIQRTPGYVAHLLQEGFETSGAFKAQGGHIDVGMHSDCALRDTIWSLVSCVLESLLNEEVRQGAWIVIQTFKLALLQSQVNKCQDLTILSHESFDDAAEMIEHIAQRTADKMKDSCWSQESFKFFATQCIKLKRILDDLVCLMLRSCHEQSIINYDFGDRSNPSISMDLAPDMPDSDPEARAIIINELVNAEHHPVEYLPEKIGYQKAIDHLYFAAKENDEMLPIVLDVIESLVFLLAVKYLDDPLNSKKVHLEYSKLCELEDILCKYRKALNQYLKLKNGEHILLKATMLSRQVLVMWIFYCLCHQNACVQHPLLSSQGAALNPKVLANLNLGGHKESEKIVLLLHRYLKVFYELEGGVFRLNKGSSVSTIEFAEQFGAQDAGLKFKLEEFNTYGRELISDHWKEVEKLIAEVEDHKDNLEFYRCEMRKCDREFKKGAKRFKDLQILYGQEYNRILRLEASPPDPVYMPLPSSPSAAYGVLFFLFMPQALRLLSSAAFLAQQQLMINNENPGERKVEKEDWMEYCRNNLKNEKLSIAGMSQGHVALVSFQKKPSSKSIRPDTLSSHMTERDGIWYPDKTLTMEMQWNGGDHELDRKRTSNYDPYCVSSTETTELLTPIFINETLQWAISLDAMKKVPLNRGNLAIAFPKLKPEFYNQSQFREFAAIRAQPFLQYKSLCTLLHRRKVPLENPMIRPLVMQLLGQIGTISNTSRSFEWRHYIDYSWIANELDSYTEEIKQAPSKMDTSALLALIASHFSRMNPACGGIARKLSKIVEEWTKEVEEEIIRNNSDAQVVSELKTRAAIMYAYGLSCYSNLADITAMDVEKMCQMRLKFVCAKVHASRTEHGDLVNALDNACRECFVSQRTLIQHHLKSNLNDIMYRIISPMCGSLPPIECFEQWVCAGQCYYSVTVKDKDIASVHVDLLLSGTILVNGRLLSGMPSAISKHYMFKRTFGSSDFEVRTNSNGAAETLSEVNGKIYTFELMKNNRLRIWETGDDMRFLLLDDEAKREHNFPNLCMSLYSQWYLAEQQVIIFRGIFYSDRRIMFICLKDICYQVRSTRELEDWRVLKSETGSLRRLFVDDGNMVVQKSLAQLEIPEFVLQLECPENDEEPKGTIVYYLPRYNLEFAQVPNDPYVYSKNWRDNGGQWRLDDHQLLPNTLVGFRQYIVLLGKKGDDDHRRVICPQGIVSKDTSEVKIAFSKQAGDSINYLAFDLDARTSRLKSCTIIGRLQLAAIYTATSFKSIQDPFLHHTGHVEALHLVQACFTTGKVSDITCWKNIADLSRFVGPNLYLWVAYFFSVNRELRFLNAPQSENLENENQFNPIKDDSGMKTLYMFKRRSSHTPPGLKLHEEKHLFKTNITERTRQAGWKEITPNCLDEIDDLLLPVKESLGDLFGYKVTEISIQEFEFPLCIDTKGPGTLGGKFMDNFRKSAKAHHGLSSTRHDVKLPSNTASLCELKMKQKKRLNEIEAWLIKILRWSYPHDHTVAAQLEQVTEQVCIARHFRDWAIIASDESKINSNYNPWISQVTCSKIRKACLCLLETMVFIDKIDRFIDIRHSEAKIIKELQVERVWSAEKHPDWLVFEAEQHIQIRPVQFHVTQYLLRNPGKLIPLQVGEGKTRVILPMLVLAFTNSKTTVRINFLPELLQEATTILTDTLANSVLCRPVFVLPFSREVHMFTSSRMRRFKVLCKLCRDSRGWMSVTPQQMLSIDLKVQSFRLANDDSCDLAQVEDFHTGCIDILDESDEHLNPRFHLVYTVGAPAKLSAMESRCSTIEAVFEALKQMNVSLELGTILYFGNQGDEHTAFKQVHLKPYPGVNEFSEDAKSRRKYHDAFNNDVLSSILKNPPDSLSWMKLVQEKALLFQQILDVEIEPHSYQNERFDEDILALRGLLAFKNLNQCLRNRASCNFGLRLGCLKAVPYRANLTPSLKSQFSDPDCEMLYTYITYFVLGISFEQVVAAFSCLVVTCLVNQYLFLVLE